MDATVWQRQCVIPVKPVTVKFKDCLYSDTDSSTSQCLYLSINARIITQTRKFKHMPVLFDPN